MHLTPREIDKLMLHQAGFLAQKRLARGVRLNYPEAVALIATQLLEFIRDGRPVPELMDLGRQLLGRQDVAEGVPDMIEEVQVEGTFPDGTKLVTVHHPIVAERGDLSLALYGSFLTPSGREAARPPVALEGAAGAVIAGDGELTLNADRGVVRLEVANRGDSGRQPLSLRRDESRARVRPRGRLWHAARHSGGYRRAVRAGGDENGEPGRHRRPPCHRGRECVRERAGE
jgi:urease subunit gamma/beta